MAMAANGGAGIFKKLEVHTLTVTGRTSPSDSMRDNVYTVSHSLGEVPDFILIYPKVRMVPGTNANLRIVDMILYTSLGVRLAPGGFVNGADSLIRTYVNASDSKYFQIEPRNDSIGTNFLNNITSQSITVGGVSAGNSGIFNGEYVVMLGKIADEYLQGEQTIYNS